MDGLVSRFFPSLSAFDDRIDDLEDQVFIAASDDQLQEIVQMKRQLVAFRKAVTPQRDAFDTSAAASPSCRGSTAKTSTTHYFRDASTTT